MESYEFVFEDGKVIDTREIVCKDPGKCKV